MLLLGTFMVTLAAANALFTKSALLAFQSTTSITTAPLVPLLSCKDR